VSAPVVSVMLPTYNQAAYIEDAVRSAVEQDYPNVQVVVSDDGSTDGTGELVLELARRWPDRVVPIVGEPNVGITLNCNRALARCTGEFVAFHAGDDVFLPGKLRAQVEWLTADARRVLCGHDVEAFDGDTGETLYHMSDVVPLVSGVGAAPWIRRGMLYGGVSMMVRTSALPPWRYDPRVPYASDWLMFIECLAAGGHFGYVDGVYARYRRHPQNVTRAKGNARTEDQFVSLALVEARYPWLLGACRAGRAAIYRSTGVAALREGDVATARRYFAAALRQKVSLLDTTAFCGTFVPGSTSILNRLRPRLKS
jgi:glycosyltransferase involved in cell wall biosynthesis